MVLNYLAIVILMMTLPLEKADTGMIVISYNSA